MKKIERRQFLRGSGQILGSLGLASCFTGPVHASEGKVDQSKYANCYGILFDATKCIGCRTCEMACNIANKMPKPTVDFQDLRVFDKRRRTGLSSHTVVNRFLPDEKSENMKYNPVFIKYQCMHCNKPACVSACIVKALRKTEQGMVKYSAYDCIGCRYCMIACPYEIPAYEYADPLTPRVKKCTLCETRIAESKLPACVEACPQQTMLFGSRGELIKIGHDIIKKNPGKYIDEIYGENVLGGTSWMYLLPLKPSKLGLPEYSERPAPAQSESIQHSVFKYFIPPILLYIVLGAMMWRTNRIHHKDEGGKS